MKQIFLGLFVMLIIACGGKDDGKISANEQGLGSININFKRLDERVTKTVIIVSANDFADLVYEFADFKNNVMLYNIPAGENRSITVEAFDNQNTLIYSGNATGVTILAGQITLVEIILTPVGEEAQGVGNLSLEIVTNNPPEILSLTANPNPVFVDETTAFKLEFADADGDEVSILWEASAGTFDNQTIVNPLWTAPSESGDVSISVTLSDGISETEYSLVITVAIDPDRLQLVINEILADPPDDLAGDANNDGVRSSTNDEFIEVVNAGEEAVNITGFTISDTDSIRHTFPEDSILAPNQAIVIFGGGTPNLEGVLTQTASTGTLSLGNSDETISLLDPSGNSIVNVSYGAEGGDNQSITRSPDLTGNFVKHTQANPDALFSPGKTVTLENF